MKILKGIGRYILGVIAVFLLCAYVFRGLSYTKNLTNNQEEILAISLVFSLALLFVWNFWKGLGITIVLLSVLTMTLGDKKYGLFGSTRRRDATSYNIESESSSGSTGLIFGRFSGTHITEAGFTCELVFSGNSAILSVYNESGNAFINNGIYCVKGEKLYSTELLSISDCNSWECPEYLNDQYAATFSLGQNGTGYLKIQGDNGKYNLTKN